MDYFKLQLHQLVPNAVLQLSAFVSFYEGYLGVWPSIRLWCRFFYLKALASRPGGMSACGAASVYAGTTVGWDTIKAQESVKKWQHTFFVNLPEFRDFAPVAKHNWGTNPVKVTRSSTSI